MNRYQKELDAMTAPEALKAALLQGEAQPVRRGRWRPALIAAALAAAMGITAAATNLIGLWEVKQGQPMDRQQIMTEFGLSEETLTEEAREMLDSMEGQPFLQGSFEVGSYELSKEVRERILRQTEEQDQKRDYNTVAELEEDYGIRLLRVNPIHAVLQEDHEDTWHNGGYREERYVSAFVGSGAWLGKPKNCWISSSWTTQCNGWGVSMGASLWTAGFSPEDGDRVRIYNGEIFRQEEYFIQSLGVEAQIFVTVMDGNQDVTVFFAKDNVAYHMGIYFPPFFDVMESTYQVLENLAYPD